jgi:hypothetical protein
MLGIHKVFLRFLPHLSPNLPEENCKALKMKSVSMRFGGLSAPLGFFCQASVKTSKVAIMIHFQLIRVMITRLRTFCPFHFLDASGLNRVLCFLKFFEILYILFFLLGFTPIFF